MSSIRNLFFYDEIVVVNKRKQLQQLQVLSLQCVQKLHKDLLENQIHLKSIFDGNNVLFPNMPSFLFLEGKTFQNLKVSSPAPVTIFCPQGDMAKYSTRYV